MEVIAYILIMLGYGKPPAYDTLDLPPTYDEVMQVVRSKGRGKGVWLERKEETRSYGRGRAQFFRS